MSAPAQPRLSAPYDLAAKGSTRRPSQMKAKRSVLESDSAGRCATCRSKLAFCMCTTAKGSRPRSELLRCAAPTAIPSNNPFEQRNSDPQTASQTPSHTSSGAPLSSPGTHNPFAVASVPTAAVTMSAYPPAYTVHSSSHVYALLQTLVHLEQ